MDKMIEAKKCKKCDAEFTVDSTNGFAFCPLHEHLAFTHDKNCDHLDYSVIYPPTEKNNHFTTLQCKNKKCMKKFGIAYNRTQCVVD